ncbi:MAG: band 7 protein [Planctomycetaceae bacterium]|nr:band 7 protein [Planctomycetaceae bacterium]
MTNAKSRIAGRIGFMVFTVICAVAAFQFYEWTVNRVYVEPGYSLQLRYKGPPLPFLPGGADPAKPGQFARVDEHGNPLEIGVLKEMRGPGRHFLWAGWWETRLIPDLVVKPGEVAVVSSKMGEDLKNGEFLVDGDLDQTTHKGILRKVLGPGTYRINDYAYTVRKLEEADSRIQSGEETKFAGWVAIPTGYVGVVTNLAANPALGTAAGIQDSVLQPGLYMVNPSEQHVDIIGIGFEERSVKCNLVSRDGDVVLDESGEPAVLDDDSGISFLSNDGFEIHMDFTAVWGITPDQAADVVRKFGGLGAVENKVVVPQIESICRNKGAALGAVDLLEGETRLEYQDQVSEAFHKILEDKDLTLLHGFVRNIHIPIEVRKPIQEKFIADELKLTRDQELLTARTEANLREAESKVELESQRIRAETKKLVAKAQAEGDKEAEETRAETVKLVAAIEKETAELEAKAQVTLGEAKAGAKKQEAEAKPELFGLAVASFGSGTAYNHWTFASKLPEDIQLETLYAGEGTFWTDLKGFTETMLGRQTQQRAASQQK